MFLLYLLIKLGDPSIPWAKVREIVREYRKAPSASELATLIEEAKYG